jgi:hypothetical protein
MRVAAYWSANGVTVLPSLLWSEQGSPLHVRTGSAVAVRGPGTSFLEQERWFFGFYESVRSIAPSQVWIFGRVPRGLVVDGQFIMQVKTHGGQGFQIGG